MNLCDDPKNIAIDGRPGARTPEQWASDLVRFEHPPCGCCDSVGVVCGIRVSERMATEARSAIADIIRKAVAEARGT
jgi:hypothetical protein